LCSDHGVSTDTVIVWCSMGQANSAAADFDSRLPQTGASAVLSQHSRLVSGIGVTANIGSAAQPVNERHATNSVVCHGLEELAVSCCAIEHLSVWVVHLLLGL
jgi:hypothetical protein